MSNERCGSHHPEGDDIQCAGTAGHALLRGTPHVSEFGDLRWGQGWQDGRCTSHYPGRSERCAHRDGHDDVHHSIDAVHTWRGNGPPGQMSQEIDSLLKNLAHQHTVLVAAQEAHREAGAKSEAVSKTYWELKDKLMTAVTAYIAAKMPPGTDTKDLLSRWG